MSNKKNLRKEILNLMRNQDISQKEQYDLNLKEQLFKHNNFKQANSIAIVMSMDHEVNTIPIIEHLLNIGKKVFVPRTNYEMKQMEFQRILDLNSIAIDQKGIKYVNQETEISDDIDLIIVPGVVFNQAGYRIGYGGGYYDKYLSRYNGHTISLLYPFQIRNFDAESHDIPVDEMLTPNDIYGEE
ncbi:5-formyltetrahydrofolate cyclo-ligase [Mammaliicoccus sciuri]|uniref:5-formyltetrahydrofolate cyclo-ligase n=1 Tax=Mammaliicoccus sciuri TaxID=1296 RepID=UPI0019541C89|nr:5-formyltetrahydrofolate cyclo-ligase [Mammaliicoccus sciuri]MCJ0919072.1 5-formyltetrahydrofolate cyclo-ligase [Mammaliicoccus sciuri]MCJ0956771.1 5-formyltetrahydrofolate cyclo-ligase [Mammaliicoccus sciuri]MCJ0962279.1 5-formyltetrahydrofolate cyclo-ligase [Mammaliicoccus sciuri]MCJ1763515.1 5-formyltetrahydrofolate cyclo-ligase [Mammaliicoccus sciuri]MCJ1772298.1 5-formyltetrahydrofolate cyclo-ligase [Mammaliicoccus sciuri]